MKNQEINELNKKAEVFSKSVEKSIKEIKKVIVGQDVVLEKIMIALLADGHVLLEGLPGLAKTMIIKTLSDTIHGDFKRIQFTPDLLPSDIIGSEILDMKTSRFSIKKGPIFANFILADEINRAPPKVQSALLEAMQERQVTIAGQKFELMKPFLVLATQNPLESEGTYTLPEAQIDRFMFKINVEYPSKDEELEIIRRMTSSDIPKALKIIKPEDIIKMQKFCKEVYLDEKVMRYITDLVYATRQPQEYGLDIANLVEYGASPRASIWLALGAKAHAILQGRGYVIPEDVKAIAHDVMRHRIILTYEAEAEEISSDEIIDKILDTVLVP
ncbi:MAG: MoxR family ATPase [Candidatus Aenigmarchaeota archaeon]|nr:MoxR family ATPase [Candidatus Aenigmarchaeota archaeon]